MTRLRKTKLKVYRWQSHRPGVGSTRELMAAPSKAAVARAHKCRLSDLWNFGETGNANDIAKAIAHPGVTFWENATLPRKSGEVKPAAGYLDKPPPKPKPERVTLWVVNDLFQDYPQLQSTEARKTELQYLADTRLDGFGYRVEIPHKRGDESPEDAVMRYVRHQEDSAASSRESADRADRMAAAATLLLVLEPLA